MVGEVFTKEVVFALIGGSGIGIIIQNVFGIFSKRAEHKRELSKVLYERKLDAAEKGIAFYWAVYTQIDVMKISFEIFRDSFEKMEDSDLGIEIIIKQLEVAGESLMKIEQSDLIDRHRMHLYFDIEDVDFWNNEDSTILLEAIARVKHYDNHIGFLFKKIEESETDENRQNSFSKQLKDITPEYILSVQALVDVLDKNKKANLEVVEKLRKQIKDTK
jgi:hypothetical protein